MQKQNESPESAPCFAHHHLTPAHYGFLSVCRALSKGSGRSVLYFDGEGMAARFIMGPSTARKYANSLAHDGWLKILKESKRLPSGQYPATHYHVLDHDEWAAEHPGACAALAARKADERAKADEKQSKDSPRSATLESGVVRLTPLESASTPLESASTPLESASTPLESASTPLESGGNLYLLTSKKQRIPSTDMAASRLSPLDSSVDVDESVLRTNTGSASGSDLALSGATPLDSSVVISDTDAVPPTQRVGQGLSPEFMTRFGKKSKTVATAQPVPPGQDVPNRAEVELTQQAEQVLQPFHRELCIELAGKRRSWLEGVKELLCHGHSEDEIRQALQYHARKYGDSREHQSYGFDEWLKQIQREMTADVSTTTEVAS